MIIDIVYAWRLTCGTQKKIHSLEARSWPACITTLAAAQLALWFAGHDLALGYQSLNHNLLDHVAHLRAITTSFNRLWFSITPSLFKRLWFSITTSFLKAGIIFCLCQRRQLPEVHCNISWINEWINESLNHPFRFLSILFALLS